MASYVDSEKNMTNEQLQLFFQKEKIHGKKQAAYKQFVSTTNFKNIPCHKGVLTVLHNKMDETTWKNSPLFLINDVNKVKPQRALREEEETLQSIWLINSRVPVEKQIIHKKWDIIKSQHKDFLSKVYQTAVEYVRTYRPRNGLNLFANIYPESTCTNDARCFVSIYKHNKRDGVALHRVWVSFCVVTICLLEDSCEDGSLVLTMHRSLDVGEISNKSRIIVQLKEGDIIAYGRFFYYLPFCKRKKDRSTLNFFL